MSSLLVVLLAATPLSVRVLEHEKPVRAHLEAKRVVCDGKALASSIDAEAAEREIRVGKTLCAELISTGETVVTVGEVSRRYPGVLHVVLEGEFLRFINDVEVEDYLPSVVASEMSGSPAAALEAQAIVSRTFAVTSRRRHAKAGYDECDLTHCQLYRGRGSESPEARAAVEKTRGQALLVGGVALRPAFFHAACGGHTSSALDVFREEGAGPGVSDLEEGGPLCRDLPDFAWEWTVDRVELARALGVSPRAESPGFESLHRDAGGRVIELKAFGRRFTGSEFISAVGRELGWQSLRSLKVTAEEAEGLIHFKGSGLGHGVGLCQQGARALATKGSSAKDILLRYFPDSQVRVPEP